ncbi:MULTISPECIES: hypothetical protein [unclassified Sphingomonas]|uniref:hypothetical protein n=1 Tax=unclassified Sphingomonas TaxID=196159 RepID=UPI001FB376DD|nr:MULTISPECIES: hypothetical protein [unclassified Sphingomonas]
MQIIGRAAQLQKVARISNGTSELFEAIACLGEHPAGDFGIRPGIDAKAAAL